MSLFANHLVTPVGPLTSVVDADGALVRLDFGHSSNLEVSPGRTAKVDDALAEYFAGQRRTFEMRRAARGTDFQHRVWDAVFAIPYGQTRSYLEIAMQLGAPNAVRAVGRANATNPIPIVVPCHRVIGHRGGLTGYAGGLSMKRRLLRLEGALPESLLDEEAVPSA